MEPRAARDLRDSVIADLRWLLDTDLTQEDESVLREMSARLRRLLIEGTLQRYRKQVVGVRGEVRVELPPSSGTGAGVVFHQAGGGTRQGMQIGGVQVWDRALTPEEIRAQFDAFKASEAAPRTLPLSRWLSETCIEAGGARISRHDVIKYVANKLGGVHLDERRSEAKEPGFIALDRIRDAFRVADLDAVYHELASIGQQLAACPDVAEMLEATG